MSEHRELPHSIAAERYLLGAAMLDESGSALRDAADIVRDGDFYRAAHARLWRLLLRLEVAGRPIDLVTVDAAARGEDVHALGGIEYVLALADAAPTTLGVTHHAETVRDLARRRELILAAQKAAGQLYDTRVTIDEALADLGKAEQERPAGWVAMADTVAETAADMVAWSDEGKPPGLDLGLVGLSALYRPQGGHLVYLAGRPKQGKTALAAQFALHVAKNGGGIGIFSMEMSLRQLQHRAICEAAGVSLAEVRQAKLTTWQRQALRKAARTLAPLPIWYDDKPRQSGPAIRRAVKRLVQQHPQTAMVVVDYIQIADLGLGESQNLRVAELSGMLKQTARESGVVVLALSQLNRGVENRTPPKPRASDLRDSGSLEQDADAVLMIWRPDHYDADIRPGEAELVVAANRHGPSGDVALRFDGPLMRFTDLMPPAAPPPAERWSGGWD